VRRFAALRGYAKAHPRLLVVAQLVVLGVFFGAVGWALRGSFHDAAKDLRDADPVLFVLACVAVAAYYLVFVIGWMWLMRSWGIRISYATALRAEMVSMLAKYVPGGVWTPAARVVAMRRAGVTNAPLVTAAMLIEAGISAVAGVIVFVVSLAWVGGVDAPTAPLVAFAVVVAVLLHPRIFQPLASRILRRLGYGELPRLRGATMLSLLGFYCATWVIGGVGLWLLVRSVGAHPGVSSIVFLGGTSAVGAIVAVLSVFAPSGLGPREASMYGLMTAIVSSGAALGATVLNRVAITLVEVLLLAVGGLVLRLGARDDQSARPTAPRQPATSAETSRSGS
jgi:glycosyltransferase 2 family protein